MVYPNNPFESLKPFPPGGPVPPLPGWDRCRTAILVIHGIGDQVPLETLDDFGRTLVETLGQANGVRPALSHGLAERRDSSGRPWFDNYLRMTGVQPPEEHHLDLYEYYWANKTEDKVNSDDVQAWVSEVTRGAKTFYKENAELAATDEPSGFFTTGGKFHWWRYRLLLGLVGALIPGLSWSTEALLRLLARIPLVGGAARSLLTSFFSSTKKRMVNTVGEIVAYTAADRHSRFFQLRQDILGGAVEAFLYLLGSEDGKRPRYDRVLLAGHSLGTQVAFDAVNRVVHRLDEGTFEGWDNEGNSTLVPGLTITQVFAGLITFGSPLDKIAFFLRGQVPAEAYIRRQMAANYHSFKQRDWNVGWTPPTTVRPPFPHRLDTVPWRNYFDRRDYVSGSLDYYFGLTNIDARLPKKFFTHNDYWAHVPMYIDLAQHFLK
jgi:hypothetical protein